MKQIWMLPTLIVALAGCQTTDPYTRQPKTSNMVLEGTANGIKCSTDTALGGLQDGLRGGVPKNFLEIVVRKGTDCAIEGVKLGADLDRQESELLAELRASGVKIAIRQNADVLEVSQPITFAKDSASLDGASKDIVIAVGKVLARYNQNPVDVLGHTASDEKEAIGRRRAEAVASVIRSKAGRLDLKTKNLAATQPLGAQASETGRDRNRRVVIFISLAGRRYDGT